jgi:hypothetical protein
MKRRSEQGVALVITLILLSVITFMAVTFLVLAQRGREQTSALTDKTIAKEANEQAVQMGLGQILSRMLAATNGFFLEPLVSTNYVSFAYDTSGGGLTAVTNVNYTYPNGARLTAKDLVFMLNNQLILPRAPVFVVTNKAFPNNPEFRFYLDLNRNFKFEDTGFTPDLDNAGNTFPSGTNVVTFSQKLGDPQWIGILDHPDQRHSPSNRYIARVAYFIQPIGNSLDFNFIHNQAKQPGTNVDGYFRNQGIASWEINFAGFLNALNLNQWTYRYDTNTIASTGTAFSDAVAMLRYRYAGTYRNLKPFRTLYGNSAAVAFSRDGIDGYCMGPLQTTWFPIQLNPATGFDNDLNWVGTREWSGWPNSNFFYTVEEMFNFPNYNVANGISNSFALAGQRTNSYDAYTFYRMMSQIGVESVPDSTGKMNLNLRTTYTSWDGTNSSNFTPWTPVGFFTNAANRLLSAHADFADDQLSTGNIQIYPTNRNHYSPAVHRMLQMAANMYDASTNKITAAPDDFDYPSVFRPVFGLKNGTNIYIVDYVEVTNGINIPTPYSLQDDVTPLIAAINAGGATNVVNIYGIPWVVGARKGFPNFNKFSMQHTVQLSRKLQITRPLPPAGLSVSTWHTNVQYTIGVSNILAVEAWNSYSATYPRTVRMAGLERTTVTLTNEFGILTTTVYTNNINMVVVSNTWAGFPPTSLNTNRIAASFRVPVSVNQASLPASIYSAPFGLIDVRTVPNTFFETTAGYPQPQFGVNITNRLQFVMVDDTSGRVIDYVQFDGMDTRRNVISELAGTELYGPSGVWDTNRVGYLTNPNVNSNSLVPINGIEMQIAVSQNYQTNGSWKSGYNVDVTENDWSTVTLPGGFSSREDAIQKFQAFMNQNASSTLTSIQVPYTPTRTIAIYNTWQANDPLVHYTLTDLTGLGTFSTLPITNWDRSIENVVAQKIQKVNDRYLPWTGLGNQKKSNPEYSQYLTNRTIKDPLITSSDAWYFPSNKFATIGDLGRVHRGTPWQTIYFKSDQVDNTFWQNWTGDNLKQSGIDDSDATRPTNDWEMLDLFTTAVNDNASRGTLSINQTNLAAWAAIFDGVIALSNAPGGYVPVVIGPDFLTGAFPAITNLVAGINGKRNDYSHNVFTRLGDILATRELSVASPFLDTNSTVNPPNDAAYEWLPKQILSLLRVGSPRYVIYAYSQSLKPANNGYFTGGGGISSIYTGTVTNYQVTGEVVTRTVVRIEPTDLKVFRSDDPFTALNPTRNPVMPDVGFGNRHPPKPNPRAVVESFTILPPE